MLGPFINDLSNSPLIVKSVIKLSNIVVNKYANTGKRKENIALELLNIL